MAPRWLFLQCFAIPMQLDCLRSASQCWREHNERKSWELTASMHRQHLHRMASASTGSLFDSTSAYPCSGNWPALSKVDWAGRIQHKLQECFSRETLSWMPRCETSRGNVQKSKQRLYIFLWWKTTADSAELAQSSTRPKSIFFNSWNKCFYLGLDSCKKHFLFCKRNWVQVCIASWLSLALACSTPYPTSEQHFGIYSTILAKSQFMPDSYINALFIMDIYWDFLKAR